MLGQSGIQVDTFRQPFLTHLDGAGHQWMIWDTLGQSGGTSVMTLVPPWHPFPMQIHLQLVDTPSPLFLSSFASGAASPYSEIQPLWLSPFLSFPWHLPIKSSGLLHLPLFSIPFWWKDNWLYSLRVNAQYSRQWWGTMFIVCPEVAAVEYVLRVLKLTFGLCWAYWVQVCRSSRCFILYWRFWGGSLLGKLPYIHLGPYPWYWVRP